MRRILTAIVALAGWIVWVSGASTAAKSSETTTTTLVQEHSANKKCLAASDKDTNKTKMLEQILASDYEAMDDDPAVLPSCIAALKERGAHRCWHKHSTFLEHLIGVHNILRLWGESRTIGRVGLFHSAYSNSYVNLALYDPEKERRVIRELVGEEAEEIVYLFCIIDRQEVVVNTLLKEGFIPKEGISVPHLRIPEERVFLSAETLRMLVVFTMADIADQYFGWQDQLFGGGGKQGSMIIPGQDFADRHDSKAIWPGISKPGLWMSYLSQLAKVARTFDPTWEQEEQQSYGNNSLVASRMVPPVFANCTQTLSVEDEAAARDLYWSVVSGEVQQSDDQVIATLQACSDKNPWAFEPLVILAQMLIHRNDFDAAIKVAERALELQQQWGTAYDKRLSFGAWVAWTRVLLQRAQDKEAWPSNSWDVINLGLVR